MKTARLTKNPFISNKTKLFVLNPRMGCNKRILGTRGTTGRIELFYCTTAGYIYNWIPVSDGKTYKNAFKKIGYEIK